MAWLKFAKRDSLCVLVPLMLVAASVALSPTEAYAGVQRDSVPATAAPLFNVRVIAAGIADYPEEASLVRFSATEKDAQSIHSIFSAFYQKGKPGLAQPILLVGKLATRQALLAALSVPPRDPQNERGYTRNITLFFWSGHTRLPPDKRDLFLPTYGPPSERDLEDSNTTLAKDFEVSLMKDILPKFSGDSALIFVCDCVHSAEFSENLGTEDLKSMTVISAGRPGETVYEHLDGGRFTTAFAQFLTAETPGDFPRTWWSAADLYVYTHNALLRHGFTNQLPTLRGVNAHKHRFHYTPASAGVTLALDSGLLKSFVEGPVSLEASRSRVDGQLLPERKVITLGQEQGTMLQRGLHRIGQKGRQQLAYWAGDKLVSFPEPYRTSRAVLVAIDDYDRKRDPKRRPPTGLPQLGFMAQGAEKLRAELIKLGFPRENITTYYDERAESGAIEETLKEYWEGGRYANTDRLFFYFAGHGLEHDGQGLLATYDYDPQKPTITSLHMNSINQLHFRNVRAHHFLVALDACLSGLALPKQLSGYGTGGRQRDEGYEAILVDLKDRARNLLVASTASQPALAKGEGLFTRALTEAMQGEGDANKDGITTFGELEGFLRYVVVDRAGKEGFDQTPEGRSFTTFGNGRVLFLTGLEN